LRACLVDIGQDGRPAAGGTFLIYACNAASAAVSMDSRTLLGDGRYSDAVCKILPLSEDMVFFAFGMSSLSGAGVALDVYAEACHAFAKHRPRLGAIARAWASAFQASASAAKGRLSLPPNWGQDGNILSRGFFLEIAAEAVAIATSTLTLDGKWLYSQTDLIAPPRLAALGGDLDLVARLLTRYAATPGDFVARDIDAQAAILKLVTDQVIAASLASQGPNSPIGGTPAVLTATAGQGWRWFTRPSFCPA
jgi:hypothetical protein